MRSSFLSRGLLVVFLFSLALPVVAQQRNDDEIVRGFVGTRGTEVVTSGKSRPKPKPKPARAIGFGYTLFKPNSNGELVRVNPAQEFRNGDKLRFVIESNTDGYFYLFHQMNDILPKMIYPDAKLTKWGDNRIVAHKPRNLWVEFVAPAAKERFYLVVARTRLPAVLSGERLVAFCQQRPQDCPWRPADTTWKQLLAQANRATRESRSQTFGAAQTEVERAAMLRDVKLQPDDPAPAVIKISTSPLARMLMTTIELVHK